eukprot:4431007-Amphidinium_carterae.1
MHHWCAFPWKRLLGADIIEVLCRFLNFSCCSDGVLGTILSSGASLRSSQGFDKIQKNAKKTTIECTSMIHWKMPMGSLPHWHSK